MPETTDNPVVEEQAAEPACSVCDEPESDCECFHCPACDFVSGDLADCCAVCDECRENCCRCTVCRHCDRRYAEGTSHICDNCEGCERCCECRYCETCGYNVSPDRYCGECDCCDDDCRCNNDRRVDLIDNPLTFHTAVKTEHTKNKSHRYISVEIEVERCDEGSAINWAVDNWGASIVEDGSLPDSGFEINTAPANGDLFVQQIEEITKALSKQDAAVSTSCGLHVHIDARDFSYYDIRRLIMLYAAIENSLYRMVPRSRRENNYCRPCGEIYKAVIAQGKLPKSSKKGIIRALYKGDSTQGKRTHKYQDCRYYALNLHSWLYRGTVECRLFNGTVDREKITNWGMLWASILDSAMGTTEATIEQLTKEKTADNLVLYLCPTETVRQWVQARWEKWDR